MHGNVWEWVEDAYGPYPAEGGTQSPARAAERAARILRGGGWFGFVSIYRSANRFRDGIPENAANDNGFRVARTVRRGLGEVLDASGESVRATRLSSSWDAEVLSEYPDPAVVTDVAARSRIFATGLPWRVRDRKTGIVMLLCPPGDFTMGSPASEAGRFADETQHRRTIFKAFYLGETEVTQEQWQCVMGGYPSSFKGRSSPVEQVSWDDCKRFCASTGFRLPTEAEWEYACRAGTTDAYAGPLEGMGWYDENSGGRTHAVETKQANPWGLFDMHGNVWEWCEDGYGRYPSLAATQDAARNAEGGARVLRGGGWYYGASFCRSANRHYDAPGGTNGFIGFRVARTPD
jgi:formylglycine-generating enzyme required for sulfatase activity